LSLRFVFSLANGLKWPSSISHKGLKAMKANQAWGWLAAGVLAAGLNANYYDGGFQWAHRVAERAGHSSAAVLALASGQAEQFLTEARVLAPHAATASCPLATTLARVQTTIARSYGQSGHFEAMSARQETQLAKLQANRARMGAQIAVQAAHFRIASAAFAPVAFKVLPAPAVCPRVRVNIPRVPMMKMPVAPVIHIETASLGPV
jgi:hypothetical protein